MTTDFRTLYLDELFRGLRGHKRLADDAIAQLTDEQFFAQPDPDSLSVALIVKHIGGNLRSRFTDFLTTDGEKPDRNRDHEFLADSGMTRDSLLQAWEKGWQLLFDTINRLHADDLLRTVTIRAEPHSVLQALSRAAAHLAYHAGQIVYLAKHWRGAEWKSLSIPKGQSEQFLARMQEKFKSS